MVGTIILKGMQNNGIQYSILLSSLDSKTSSFVNTKLTATGNEFNLFFYSKIIRPIQHMLLPSCEKSMAMKRKQLPKFSWTFMRPKKWSTVSWVFQCIRYDKIRFNKQRKVLLTLKIDSINKARGRHLGTNMISRPFIRNLICKNSTKNSSVGLVQI